MLSSSLIWYFGICIWISLSHPGLSSPGRTLVRGVWAQPRAFEMVRGRGTEGQAEGTASDHECRKTLEQAAQRSYRCPTLGSVQSQVGQGLEQPSLM